MENPAKTLLTEVERFLDLTGTPPTTFGLQAMKDPMFVWHLRQGREPRFGTIQKVKEFIAQAQKESAA